MPWVQVRVQVSWSIFALCRWHVEQCVCLTNFIWRSISNPEYHMTFSKTKMNVNWHIHFILKCHLKFGLHNSLEKLIFWIIKIQSWFETKKNYQLSISIIWSRMFEDGSPIHCIPFKPTKRDLHKSIKGLQVQPIAQVEPNLQPDSAIYTAKSNGQKLSKVITSEL